MLTTRHVLPLSLLLAATSLLGCGDDDEPAASLTTQTLIIRDDVTPNSGAVEVRLRIENRGQGAARLISLDLIETPSPSVGTFKLAEPFARPVEIAAGASLEVPVVFEVAPTASAGCELAALAQLKARYLSRASSNAVSEASSRVVVSGPCEQTLRCAPSSLDFGEVLLETEASAQVTCLHTGSGGIEIAGSALIGEAFKQGMGWPAAGASFQAGEPINLPIIFSASRRAPYLGEVTLTQAGGPTARTRLLGTAVGKRPLCVDPAPEPPARPDRVDSYRFDLESEQIASYQGKTMSRRAVNESRAPMLKSALLLASGAYLGEFCKVSHSGATWRWEGLPCQEGEGQLRNVIPFALSERIEAQIASVEVGDWVRFEGYDIQRISREGFWEDGGATERHGNHAMLVTRVCDIEPLDP
jgi:hypothetical protein